MTHSCSLFLPPSSVQWNVGVVREAEKWFAWTPTTRQSQRTAVTLPNQTRWRSAIWAAVPRLGSILRGQMRFVSLYRVRVIDFEQ